MHTAQSRWSPAPPIAPDRPLSLSATDGTWRGAAVPRVIHKKKCAVDVRPGQLDRTLPRWLKPANSRRTRRRSGQNAGSACGFTSGGIQDSANLHAFVRGEGKWEHTGRTYRSIARYWHVLDPILKGWLAEGIESLREITRDDVKRAIATRKGTPARSIHIVLRNVFRALRQEGVIFRDPTRGLVFAGINKTPPSVPSDRLAGVLSHAQNDFQRLVMVLVCVHALSGTDIRRLLLTDLDLSRERLIVRRPGKRHIIYLDELTYRCASAWLRERHRRWPVTTNPHLLVNRWTAVDTTHSPIGTTFTAIFRPTGLTMPTLRQDRIRDEAFEVDDPLHLMRLFGISAQTAMRYITAAHPERTAKLPR